MNIKQMIEEEVTIHNANMYHIFHSSDYHKEVVIENERFISAISNAIRKEVEELDRCDIDVYPEGNGIKCIIVKKDIGRLIERDDILNLFKGEDNE